MKHTAETTTTITTIATAIITYGISGDFTPISTISLKLASADTSVPELYI